MPISPYCSVVKVALRTSPALPPSCRQPHHALVHWTQEMVAKLVHRAFVQLFDTTLTAP